MDGNPGDKLVDSKQLSGPDNRRLDSWRLDSTRPGWPPRNGHLDGRRLYWSVRKRPMDCTGLNWWLVVRRTGCRTNPRMWILRQLHSGNVGSARRCRCFERSLGHATKVDCWQIGYFASCSRRLLKPHMAGSMIRHSADGRWKRTRMYWGLGGWRLNDAKADRWPGVEHVDNCGPGFGFDFGSYWRARYG